MKIVKKQLVSFDIEDIVDGVLIIPKKATSIADNIIIKNNDIIKVVGLGITSIGNYNFTYCDALTTFELPLVTSIGNYNFTCCDALTTVEFKNKKLNVKSVDGCLFVIEKTKSTKGIYIHTGYNLYSFDKKTIEKKDCYLAEKDNFFAHGDTIKKAISDVQFKLVAEKIKNEPILPETIITVMYYRTVTGACELGCKDFIERNSLEKEEYRADELLPILEKNNAYGVEKFKSLINW